VTLPPTVQVYYMVNEAVGGVSNYDVTFTTGSGNNVTLAQGESSILICDSVNIIAAITVSVGLTNVSLNDGTVAAPSLNFANEVSTGIYRAAAGELNMAILGVNEFTLSAGGLAVPSGISGGTFT
jgi:hypothetical protein